jgi:hypothetical protein
VSWRSFVGTIVTQAHVVVGEGYKNSITLAEQALPFDSDVVASGVHPLEFRTLLRIGGGRPLLSLTYLIIRWMFATVAWTPRSPNNQALEIVVLRHQLEILKRHVARPQFQPRDRVLLAAASRFLPKRGGRRDRPSRDAAQVAPTSGHTPGAEMGEQEPGPAEGCIYWVLADYQGFCESHSPAVGA